MRSSDRRLDAAAALAFVVGVALVAAGVGPTFAAAAAIEDAAFTEHLPPNDGVRCRAGQRWLHPCRTCVCQDDASLRCYAPRCPPTAGPSPVVDAFVVPPHDHFGAMSAYMNHANHISGGDSGSDSSASLSAPRSAEVPQARVAPDPGVFVLPQTAAGLGPLGPFARRRRRAARQPPARRAAPRAKSAARRRPRSSRGGTKRAPALPSAGRHF